MTQLLRYRFRGGRRAVLTVDATPDGFAAVGDYLPDGRSEPIGPITESTVSRLIERVTALLGAQYGAIEELDFTGLREAS